MPLISEGEKLWEPDQTILEEASLTHYMRWLDKQYDLSFITYGELWNWSVTEIEQFWQTIWDYFQIKASATAKLPLINRQMPHAKWFAEARLNYAENIFSRQTVARPALFYQSETAPLTTMSWQDLAQQTAALQSSLRAKGVKQGDRVVAYLPNIPEAIIGVLATTSLGAIWSSCSPDFGSRSVIDRFGQIDPKVLLAVDGYTYGGRAFDRRPIVAELQAKLPTLEQTILFPQLSQDITGLQNTILWDDVLRHNHQATPTFAQVPFDHPLWILYSSGTTGLPKPIVHGHGGILLEHLKATHFHNDLRASDRFFWYTSTGWMMWNYLLGSLLTGCGIALYNGSPAHPTLDVLWQLAEEAQLTYFGLSPAYINACRNAGIVPNNQYDLHRLRGIGSTGSPLPTSSFAWLYEHVQPHGAVESLSGGTDLCTAFVGGCRLQPVYAGEIQGASLGASVQAFNTHGQPVIDEVGELVITQPMPSMPLFFWNDPDHRRYLASYFEMYPNMWRHGDWIKFNERGGCVIYGRSDSTINRKGIRMGTSEIYQAVESLPEIFDSLVVDLEMLGRDSYMPLFVVLAEDADLTPELKRRLKDKLRVEISPRHVPNAIFRVAEIPYTLSGKKMEVPVRRILLGQPVENVVNLGAIRNPESLQFFVQLAEQLNAQ